jgi:hypothetical protein
VIAVLGLLIGGIPIGVLIWRLMTGQRASNLELAAGLLAVAVAGIVVISMLR